MNCFIYFWEIFNWWSAL